MECDDMSMGVAARSVASQASYTLQKKDAGLSCVDSSSTFSVPTSAAGAPATDFDATYHDVPTGVAARSVASQASYTLQKKDAGLSCVDSSSTFSVPTSAAGAPATDCGGTCPASASTASAPAPAPAQQRRVFDAAADINTDEEVESALAPPLAPVLAQQPHFEPEPDTPADGGKVPEGSARDRVCCGCHRIHTKSKDAMCKRYGAPDFVCSSCRCYFRRLVQRHGVTRANIRTHWKMKHQRLSLALKLFELMDPTRVGKRRQRKEHAAQGE